MTDAAQRAIDKATQRGGHDVVVWLPDQACWGVPSESAGGEMRLVARTKPPTDRVERRTDEQGKKRAKGYWWFFFQCDCPAASKYLLCWHKAAVYLWCRHWHNFDPRVQPLDTARGGSYQPNEVAPSPEDTATILQTAGPSTAALNEALTPDDRDGTLRERFGDAIADEYLARIRDDGPREAMAWLESLPGDSDDWKADYVGLPTEN